MSSLHTPEGSYVSSPTPRKSDICCAASSASWVAPLMASSGAAAEDCPWCFARCFGLFGKSSHTLAAPPLTKQMPMPAQRTGRHS
eukprot:8318094-Alexandrium_andersonii.AAC.1